MRKQIRILLMLTLMMFIPLNAQWIVWEPQNNLSDKMTGKVIIDGEEVVAMATVTSDLITEPDVTYKGENNNVLQDFNGVNEDYRDTFKNSLGVSHNSEFVYSKAGAFNYPNIISITFNKDVVINTLSLTDINQYPERWTDSYTIEGYNFDSYKQDLEYSQNANITNQGVNFNSNYSVASSNGRNYIRHFGSDVLKAGTPIKIKYIGMKGKRGGLLQGFKYTGISNLITAFAINVKPAVCYVEPANGEALQTFVGVSTLNRNTENWLPERLGAYLALESTNKGFIITRTGNPNEIQNPEEGMIVWDTSENCLKLYSNKSGTSQWKCIKQGCNK